MDAKSILLWIIDGEVSYRCDLRAGHSRGRQCPEAHALSPASGIIPWGVGIIILSGSLPGNTVRVREWVCVDCMSMCMCVRGGGRLNDFFHQGWPFFFVVYKVCTCGQEDLSRTDGPSMEIVGSHLVLTTKSLLSPEFVGISSVCMMTGPDCWTDCLPFANWTMRLDSRPLTVILDKKTNHEGP